MSTLITIKPINDIKKVNIDKVNPKLKTRTVVDEDILKKLKKFNKEKKGLIPEKTIFAIKPELNGTHFKEYKK